MQTTIEHIAGDTEGVTWRVPVLRFSPRAGTSGPSAYLQAALHANEQPGTGALHVLSGMLRDAEAAGRLLGPVTVVPVANPIGLAQHLFGEQMGRFDTASRVNFNRDYPLLDRPDPALLDGGGPVTGAAALKRRLLGLALPHDIVLDLHCDDEAVPYLYLHAALWPAGQDLAAALGAEAVVLWDGPDGGAAFEEAALAPWLALPAAESRLDRRMVSTVELRGRRDVSEELGRHDAEGLWRFLLGRGVVAGEPGPPRAFDGLAASIRRVTMVRSPRPGPIWYHVAPGDRVEAGDRLATVLHGPGEAGGALDVLAPHAGYVLTRRAHRFTRAGEDLLKLVGRDDSASYRPGTLEA
jgi:hypothetical protein